MTNHRRTLFRTIALLAMICVAKAVPAVTVPEIVALKDRIARHQTLSAAEIELAKRVNETTTSRIDLTAAMTGTPTGDTGRRPYNPLDEYIWTEVPYQWIDISEQGVNTGIFGDDVNAGPFDLGFLFPFFGSEFGQVYICSNGWLSFTSNDWEYWNIDLPDPEEPNNVIYAWWDDLAVFEGAMVTYLADSINNRFVVHWHVTRLGSDFLFDFEVALYPSGDIRINYQTVDPENTSCTVGLENGDASEWLQVASNGQGTLPTAAWSILLGQPDGVPAAVTNLSGNWNGTDVVLTWTDPTEDTNGNPLTPDNVQVWLGRPPTGTLLGTVAAGVQSFTHVNPPSGNHTYFVRPFHDPFLGASRTVTLVVGTPSYSESFETGNGGWVAEPDNGWQWGVPANPQGPPAYDGANVWATGLNGNYPDNACFHLTLDLGLNVVSTTATVEFYHWLNGEWCCDGFNFKVSIDDGMTWDIVEPLGGYTDEPLWYPCLMNEDNNRQPTAGWEYIVFPLGLYLDQAPIFRIDFGSDGSVTNPGLFIDNMLIWGLAPPVLANVSGTVTLDGGAGSLTAVAVRSSGIGNPVTNPDAAGAYLLDSVAVGERRITATLDGYHTAEQVITVVEGGVTGVNFTLRRLDPPMPTGLSAVVNSTTGLVTLNWDDSPDPLVDRYRIYRKLQADLDWTLVDSAIVSQATHQLTADGIYEFRVTAMDVNVLPPAVESEPSRAVTALFGELPPTHLEADGNFDAQIVLSWLAPGQLPSFELSYDDGSVEGWARPNWVNFQNDYMAQRFTPPSANDADYPLPVQRITLQLEDTLTLPYVSLCPDLFGAPDLDNPLAIWSGLAADGQPGWLTVPVEGAVSLTDTLDFWVVWQLPPGELGPSTAIDDNDPQDRAYWSTEPGIWNQQRSADYFCRVWVGGPPPAQMQSLPRVERALHRFEAAPLSIEDKTRLGKQAAAPAAQAKGPVRPRMAAVSTTALRLQAGWSSGRGRGGTLDDVSVYRVFRDGTFLTEVPAAQTTYIDGNRVENTQHQYHVIARYDNNQDSPASNTVAVACNMAPGAPISVDHEPLGQTQMRITWQDPTTNADGTTCTDLAAVRIYRDGVQIGQVNAGVQQYTDTPPENNAVYTWEVRALDEVPNVGPGATTSGAVVSPWEEVEFEWVDIQNQGSQVVQCDDCAAPPLALGFDFEYYGQTYNQVTITSNGWLSFTWNEGWATTWLPCLPGGDTPNATLAVFAADLNPGTGGQVLYYADAEQQRFVVSWINVPRFPAEGSYTLQCVIEEGGGIRFAYQSMTEIWCTVGVENESGTDAISLYCDGSGIFTPSNGSAVQFWGGPEGQIAGTVRAQDTNVPIENCRVWATGWPDTLLTAVNGQYLLEIDPGIWQLHFEHPHFCDSTVSVVVVDDQTTPRDMVLRAPQAQFSVSSLTFEVGTGMIAQQQFQFSNPGGQCPLDFAITDTSAWLSAAPAVGTINPGQQITVTVTVNMQGVPVGEWFSALRVAYNAAGSPRIIPVDVNVLSADDPRAPLPTVFALRTAYPNPFNATTMLRFDLPQESRVEIVIFNVMGQEVARPVNALYAAGRHRIAFNAEDLPSGMYLVRMTAGTFTAMDKIMLLK